MQDGVYLMHRGRQESGVEAFPVEPPGVSRGEALELYVAESRLRMLSLTSCSLRS